MEQTPVKALPYQPRPEREGVRRVTRVMGGFLLGLTCARAAGICLNWTQLGMSGGSPEMRIVGLAASAALTLLTVVSLVTSIGLLRVKGWSRRLAVIWSCLHIAYTFSMTAISISYVLRQPQLAPYRAIYVTHHLELLLTGSVMPAVLLTLLHVREFRELFQEEG